MNQIGIDCQGAFIHILLLTKEWVLKSTPLSSRRKTGPRLSKIARVQSLGPDFRRGDRFMEIPQGGERELEIVDKVN